MTEIRIPHEYLPALLRMRAGSIIPSDLDKMDEFIAAAEADQPPLPEGWVLLRLADRSERVLWHHGGRLSVVKPQPGLRGDFFGDAEDTRDLLTPLRPTVTEADVEKAARAARAAYYDDPRHWDEVHQDVRDDWMKTTRVALDALGIDVTS